MAGNIQGLSLAQLDEVRTRYNQTLQNIRTTLNNVTSEFQNLKNSWTGKRMNAVIDKYNEANKKISTAYNFFDKTVYSVLHEIWLQYYTMENEGRASDQTTISTGLEYTVTLIEATDTENVKFEQELVLSTSNNVTGNLDDVVNKFVGLVDMLDELAPCSDSLNKLVTTYKSHAETVVSSLKEVKETLSSEINDAIKVVQTTEGYNDNDANRIQQSEE